MSEPITYVGIDAHKAQLQVAVLAPEAAEPTIWTVRNEARMVDRLRRRLAKVAPGPIACCYEAGPCGYALQRQLERGRVRCDVIAPALVPRKPGERRATPSVRSRRPAGCPDPSVAGRHATPGTARAAKGVHSPSTLRGVLAKGLQCRTPARVRSCVTQTSLRHLGAP